jgi:CheY-like chemotaxis protein
MAGNERKLVLIVDDTPTNVAVVSGVLKGFIQDQSRDQWREGARHRLRA